MNKKINESILMATGMKDIELKKSDEEAIDIMKALLGLKTLKTNVNYINNGQVEYLPLGSLVESNCIFSENSIKPLKSNNLPKEVEDFIIRNTLNNNLLYEGIKERDLNKIFISFKNQPFLDSMKLNDKKALFKEMVIGTRRYLDKYYDLDKLDLI